MLHLNRHLIKPNTYHRGLSEVYVMIRVQEINLGWLYTWGNYLDVSTVVSFFILAFEVYVQANILQVFLYLGYYQKRICFQFYYISTSVSAC